jgi:hypothetical protein
MQGASMIDFDGLVLNRCENIFSIVCKFTLSQSKPEAPVVICRGIYSKRDLDVEMQDGTIFSDHEVALGIRLRDFAIAPDIGDLVEIIDQRHPAFGNKYFIGDSDDDGQGGATLLLRTKEPS